jgi:N-acetylglucosaminyl-diphospho-decaprenol L-rhamnosyltransferase
MSSSPKVSFITVAYKTPHLIRMLLKGIEAAKFAFPFEYILVDNGGDGTAAMVRERFPWVTVIEPGENLGFGKGNNLAIREAKGEYVMFTNPDLTVFQGEMEKLIAFADAMPDAGLIGPRVEHPNGDRQPSCTRYPHPLIPAFRRTFLGKTPWGKRSVDAYLMEDVDHDQAHDVDVLWGAAILARKSALDAFGYFDDRFFMYYEDIDLCRRAWAGGWRVVYAPVARFVHYYTRESVIANPLELITKPTTRYHIASGIKYHLKYRGIPVPQAR